MGVAQISRARVTQLFVFGSIYQAVILVHLFEPQPYVKQSPAAPLRFIQQLPRRSDFGCALLVSFALNPFEAANLEQSPNLPSFVIEPDAHAGPLANSPPELLDFKLFGRTILMVPGPAQFPVPFLVGSFRVQASKHFEALAQPLRIREPKKLVLNPGPRGAFRGERRWPELCRLAPPQKPSPGESLSGSFEKRARRFIEFGDQYVLGFTPRPLYKQRSSKARQRSSPNPRPFFLKGVEPRGLGL